MAAIKWFLNTVEQTTLTMVDLSVSKSVKDYTGMFNFKIANPLGVNEDKISQNDTIKIQLYDYDASAWDTVLEGYVDAVEKDSNYLIIRGSDWSGRLYDRDVNETYRHREISWMVKDIIADYFPEFTDTNVTNTGTESEMNTQTSTDGTFTMNLANEKLAQKFTPTVTNVIKVSVFVQNNASGEADFELRADSGGTPSTTDVLASMSNVTLANGWNEVYVTRKNLDTATSYWLVVTWKAGTFDLSTEGSANTGRVAYSSADPESWATQNYDDLAFKTYSTTGKIIEKVKYSGKKAADCFKELAEVIGSDTWIFYVDNDEDVHFEPESTLSSGYTYTDATSFGQKYRDDSKQLYNHVYVYGGEELTENATNSYVGNGQQKVYILSPGRPDRLKRVQVGGTTTTAYTADLENNLIVMDAAVGNGVQLDILHDYRTPVIAESENPVSIAAYGERMLSKSDKNIVSNDRAKEISDALLRLHSDPRTTISRTVFWNPNLLAGYLVQITSGILGIDTLTDYRMSKVTHKFGKQGLMTTVDLISNDIASVPEVLKQLKSEIETVRMQNVDTDAPVRKLLTLTDSMELTNDDTKITKKWRYICDSFVVDHDENGIVERDGAELSGFEDHTDWSASGLSLSDNATSTYIWVGSKSMKCDWVASGSATITNTDSQGDLSDSTGTASGTPSKGTCGLWIYRVAGATFGDVKLRIGSGASDYIECTADYISDTSQADGWNYVTFDLDSPDSTTGTPDWTAVDYIRIEINKTSTTGTVYLEYLTISESNTIGLNGVGYRYVEVTI